MFAEERRKCLSARGLEIFLKPCPGKLQTLNWTKGYRHSSDSRKPLCRVPPLTPSAVLTLLLPQTVTATLPVCQSRPCLMNCGLWIFDSLCFLYNERIRWTFKFSNFQSDDEVFSEFMPKQCRATTRQVDNTPVSGTDRTAVPNRETINRVRSTQE